MRNLIDSFIQYCEAERGLSKATITSYRYNLLRFSNYAKDTPLENITFQFIREFLKLKGLNQRISAIVSLRVFGKFLKREGIENSFVCIEIPKRPKKIPEVLNEAEINKLFTSLETPEEKVVFEVLYSAGLRISEFLNLTIQDVNFKDGTVRINKGKGNKDGVVPIGSYALRAIKEYGLPELTRSRVYAMFQKYSVILGKRIYPHMLRKTCATEMLRGGAGIMDVKEQLRHADVSTTQIYTKVYPETLKKTRNLLDKKDNLDGYLPSLPKFEPKVKTPEEIKEEKELAESYKAIMKREEVNPLLNAEQAGKILGMYKQSVTGYARTGELKGEYMKGCGWFFRKNYIDFVNKMQPDWLVEHKKFKRRDIREMMKKAIEILKESGKKLASSGIDMRIHYNKQVYMLPRKLADELGVSVNWVYKTLLPALYRSWAKQKLFEAWKKEFETEMIEEVKLLEEQSITEILV